MLIQKVTLVNYRNYERASVELGPGRNILIGDNAQGKTNFLESIEYVSHGSSWRASQDIDLIKLGARDMRIDVNYTLNNTPESIMVAMRRNASAGSTKSGNVSESSNTGSSINPATGRGVKQLEKAFKLNGLTQTNLKSITHRLVTVSFKSHDLNLLRSGPKFRRDWIDAILLVLKPQYKTIMASYQKVILQRNRLLKQLSEKGRVSVSDNDQMRAWDEQTARFGAQIIKERISLINKLLPSAERYQETLSGNKETLTCEYQFKSEESKARSDEGYDDSAEADDFDFNSATEKVNSQVLERASLAEVTSILMRQLKALRFEEIRRKQTLIGPHRDDLRFLLNGADAVHFASQGQQRSLVLSFKLAELKAITDYLDEPPVLLLDDVLAELDLSRQSLLMSVVGKEMQTIITTTHVTGFKPEWLEGASFLEVDNGSVRLSDKLPSLN
jgi:DNA replication and repair protein RecF